MLFSKIFSFTTFKRHKQLRKPLQALVRFSPLVEENRFCALPLDQARQPGDGSAVPNWQGPTKTSRLCKTTRSDAILSRAVAWQTVFHARNVATLRIHFEKLCILHENVGQGVSTHADQCKGSYCRTEVTTAPCCVSNDVQLRNVASTPEMWLASARDNYNGCVNIEHTVHSQVRTATSRLIYDVIGSCGWSRDCASARWSRPFPRSLAPCCLLTERALVSLSSCISHVHDFPQPQTRPQAGVIAGDQGHRGLKCDS